MSGDETGLTEATNTHVLHLMSSDGRHPGVATLSSTAVLENAEADVYT